MTRTKLKEKLKGKGKYILLGGVFTIGVVSLAALVKHIKNGVVNESDEDVIEIGEDDFDIDEDEVVDEETDEI